MGIKGKDGNQQRQSELRATEPDEATKQRHARAGKQGCKRAADRVQTLCRDHAALRNHGR
jgi:hypothetical protein